jgi:hypothetical protein
MAATKDRFLEKKEAAGVINHKRWLLEGRFQPLPMTSRVSVLLRLLVGRIFSFFF